MFIGDVSKSIFLFTNSFFCSNFAAQFKKKHVPYEKEINTHYSPSVSMD